MKQCLILAVMLIMAGCASFSKVTDPADPRFDINEFKLSDYKTYDEVRYVMNYLFPEGTPKEEVDHVLIDNVGAAYGGSIDINGLQYDCHRYYFLEDGVYKKIDILLQGTSIQMICVFYNDSDEVVIEKHKIIEGFSGSGKRIIGMEPIPPESERTSK